jgi:hypothetical protein
VIAKQKKKKCSANHYSLPEEYVENIKSKIADLKNIGVKGGGSITAALFLKVCVCVCARTRGFVCVCVWEADPCRIEMHLASPPPPPPSPPALPPSHRSSWTRPSGHTSTSPGLCGTTLRARLVHICSTVLCAVILYFMYTRKMKWRRKVLTIIK